jgi:sodium-dependent phosphate cotransporter
MSKKIASFLVVAGLIYLFLLSINLMGEAFKLMGRDFATALIKGTANPFVGLLIGIFTTSLVQSSSCTTSILIGLVASGSMTIRNAIPIVMGANIGTTVTNTIVSIAHITRRQEYGRAIGGATVHDFFNLAAVVILFPLEIRLHLIERLARFLSPRMVHGGVVYFRSPLKVATQPAVKFISGILHHPVIILIFALVLLFLSLWFFSNLLRHYVSTRTEIYLEERVFNNPLKSFGIGVLLTAIVQSSSCTTSILVPLVAAGILTVEHIFPYVLGANLGTTVTAMLASLATGVPASLTIAISHLLFNLLGICIIYPVRWIPIGLAKGLGNISYNGRYMAIIYTVIIFYVLPLLLVFLFR